MTENSRKVFDFLKANYGNPMTAKAIADELGVTVAAVTGSVNGLQKKGYAVREISSEEVEGKTKEIKLISLTAEGLAFDPDATVETDAE